MISSKVFWPPARKSPTENNKQQPIKIQKRNHLINQLNQNQVELNLEQNLLHPYRLLITSVEMDQKKLIHS